MTHELVVQPGNERTQIAPHTPTSIATWYHDVPRNGFHSMLAGFSIVVFGIGGFSFWASTAPIEGAVVAPGVFVATSQNKVVQHLEGGIIRELLVREGDRVEVGQTIVKLDETQPRADLKRLMLRQSVLLATMARLSSEAQLNEFIQLPPDLLTESDPEIKAAVISQTGIFDARRRKLSNEIAIQNKTIASLRQRINGDAARERSAKKQLSLIEDELQGKAKLFKAGLVRKSEYFALQRSHANVTGEITRAQSDMADSQERIGGIDEQVSRLKSIASQTAVEELNTLAGELKDIRERITAAESVLDRVDIKSPVNGVVVKLNYHTAGGVIRPGNDIMALLPVGDELVIEARVRPQDIDNLTNGQGAIVRLTALNQRVTPMMSGQVVYVSADAIPNERNQTADNSYIARVKLDSLQLSAVKAFMPSPGMPAEVYIKTEQRTFFQYLMQPVTDTMTRAFRES